MPDVSGRALLTALQAVAAELNRLGAAVQAAGEDPAPDDVQMLLAYERAQHELRVAYSEALLTATNLPPLSPIDARKRRPD